MSDLVRFAIVVDNEVVDNIAYKDEYPTDRIVAIIRSGPVYVEIPEEVELGSIWDGTTFIPPAND